MAKTLAQFHLEDGTNFLVEVEYPKEGGLESVAAPFGIGQIKKAKGSSLEKMLDQVRPIASTIAENLKGLTTPADEVAVKFGLKLTADTGVVFASLGSEVTYEICLQWKNRSNTTDKSVSINKNLTTSSDL